MLKILQSSWFTALTGGLLYLATTAFLITPAQFPPIPTHKEETLVSAGNDPSWKFRNPEFDQWLDELRHERESLAQREQQLHELQARIDTERLEISTVTQTVARLQGDFDKNVIRIKQQEVDNLKRQTKVVAGMSPEGAAAMLNEMTDEQIVRILFTLKPDQTSAILDTLSKLGKPQAQRAAILTERLRDVLPPPTK
jgi:flagellar motility protein MotE (MotC chaperone)